MNGIPGSRSVRVLFISTYPPRACGIGTFTRDLTRNICRETDITPEIAAIDISDDEAETLEYGSEVVMRISNCRAGAYRELAECLNRSDYDVVCAQHEFGIFPGEWGHGLTELYLACQKPIVTTLHTVIPRCVDLPRRIIHTIATRSAATIVMAEIAVAILREHYGVAHDRVRVIPHGVPPFKQTGRKAAKQKLGLADRMLISSFGLLSRGKGVEYMIAAMPDVVRQHPDALYLVLGQTHPVVRKHEGESYRAELQGLVSGMGLEDHVRFVDRFLSDEELSIFLEATDVYVAPYVGADQITSGALARAVFFGKAIVSTPFLYATELLANSRGRLVPFRDSAALGSEVAAVLRDRAMREAMEASMLDYARRMSWASVAREYAQVFAEVAGAPARGRIAVGNLY